MSYIVKGANEQDWQMANWAFYKMGTYLLPMLRSMKGGEALAERLEEALEMQIGYMDISDLLEDQETSKIWLRAVDEVTAQIRAEGNAHWREPDMFEPYVQRVNELKNLVNMPQLA